MTRDRLRRAVAMAVMVTGVAVAVAPRGFPDGGPGIEPDTQVLATVAFGLRVFATGLAGYIAIVLTAVVVASTGSLPAVAIQRWTSRGLAGLVRRTAGLSVVVSSVLPTTLAAAQTPTEHPPVLAPIDLPAPAPLAPARPPPPERSPPPPPSQPQPPPPQPAPATHTVTSGESFWTVAFDRVAERLGREPSDVETAEYWLGLIDANRQVLVDPDDPDLIFPGQVLRLPRTFTFDP
jgi:hypothetical protein